MMKSLVWNLTTVVRLPRVRHNAFAAMRELWTEYGSMKLGVIPGGGVSAPISVGSGVVSPAPIVDWGNKAGV